MVSAIAEMEFALLLIPGIYSFSPLASQMPVTSQAEKNPKPHIKEVFSLLSQTVILQ